MKNLFIGLAFAICFFSASTAYSDYSVFDSGEWDKSWPQELEPLRKQARTLIGPMVEYQNYAIKFTDREQFEAAWPHLLKVKTAGAPIYLKRGKNFFLGEGAVAGVVVHCPPKDQEHVSARPGANDKPNTELSFRMTTSIELVVDGDIVDLNRIELPKDTPIIDQRFEKTVK